MKKIKTPLFLILAIYIFTPMASAHNNSYNTRTWRVNCDRGQSVSRAIRKAVRKTSRRRSTQREHYFLIQGQCNERIHIPYDNIILDGQGSAVIDGNTHYQEEAVIIIDSGRKVTIKGLTIKGASGNGILGKRGAVFSVKNTTVQDTADDGIVATLNSTLTISDSVVKRSGDDGISVTQVSSVFFEGLILTTENTDDGIVIADSSTGDIRKATIQTNNNGDAGMIVGDDAVLFTGAGEQIGKIFANQNGQDGILLFNSVTLEATGGAIINASENGRSGIRLIGNAVIVSARGNSVFNLTNNPIGMFFDVLSGAFIVGGLNISNNNIGLLADAANTISIISIPPNPSKIVNNSALDVDLRFGTRSTINGAEVGSIVCDGTVLSRGSVVCPEL
jgi:hypothetical protein